MTHVQANAILKLKAKFCGAESPKLRSLVYATHRFPLATLI